VLSQQVPNISLQATGMDCFPDDILREQLENAVGEYVPGPAEVRAPVQHRRDKLRFTEVLHNFCHEPLPWYKNLEHIRPEFPNALRKWTEREGFRVADHHNVQVTTRDQSQRTKKGSLRTSSGLVTYNAIHRMQFELDAEDIASILREQNPHMQSSGKMWSVKNLDKAYQSRFRRHGSWVRQGVAFKVYLSLFPKTFDLFGSNRDYVRIIHQSRLCAIDCSEDAMISLALACEKGYVQRIAPLDGTMKAGQDASRLPELAHVRTKTLFRSSSDPGLKSHTLPAIQDSQKLLDATFTLPQLRADTMPCLPTQAMPRQDSVEGGGGGGSLASTVRFSDDARSTFRVSFQQDVESRSASATSAVCDGDA